MITITFNDCEEALSKFDLTWLWQAGWIKRTLLK